MLADHILFIDGEALILDKPAGLPVTAVRDGTMSLENHLDSLRMGFQRRPSPVHRLDRDTSGCLLLARNPKAHRRFAAAFEAGVVEKTYWAVVSPPPQAASGLIDLALHKVSTREEGWRIVPDAKGKPARTRWARLAVQGDRALIAFLPETGRTHQIRVHAAAGLGAAIVGDAVYGRGGRADAAPRAESCRAARRQAAGRGDGAAARQLRRCRVRRSRAGRCRRLIAGPFPKRR